MDRLQSMRVFKQVVAENSFSASARTLGLTPARVTRLVKDLEDHLGVQLLQRTTRRLALTAAGEAYLDRVRGVLSDLDEAEEMAQNHSREMAGCVRVLSLPGLPTQVATTAITDFQSRHPKVTIELHSDAHAARRLEAHDLALLVDQADVPGDAVVRPILRGHSILCASPDYLRRHGAPQAPQDLRDHAIVRLVWPGAMPSPLTLWNEHDWQYKEVVQVRPMLHSNDHEAVLRCTVQGVGISSQSLQLVAPLLQSGRLQRVLSPWISDRYTLIAAFASRRHMPARTRAFLDHLLHHAPRSMPAVDALAVA